MSLQALDLQLLHAIASHCHTAALDRIMPVVTALGTWGILWIVLGLVLVLFRKTRAAGAAVLCALVVDLILCNGVLKPLVDRPRPFVVDPTVQLLIAAPQDPSFPSGHTAASFASASALFCSKSKLWIPAAILALLIGFSRLYLGVHFPSDVLCGAIFGCVFGILGWYASGFPARRRPAHRDKPGQ